VNARMSELVGRFIRSFMTELAHAMEDDVGPAMTKITSATVDSAMNAAMSPVHQQQVERFSSTIVASAMRGLAQEIPQSLAPAMRKAMSDDLGPALAAVMRDDVAPGMAQMLRSSEVKAAFGETAREVAHQAVLGSNEGLAELAEKRKREEGGSPLGAIGAFFAPRMWLLGAIVVGTLLMLPLLWLVRERQRSTHYRAMAERRSARAAALLGAMEAAPEGAWSSGVLDMLRKELLEDTTQTRAEDLETGTPQRPRHA
jgi:hypothetical protein